MLMINYRLKRSDVLKHIMNSFDTMNCVSNKSKLFCPQLFTISMFYLILDCKLKYCLHIGINSTNCSIHVYVQVSLQCLNNTFH